MSKHRLLYRSTALMAIALFGCKPDAPAEKLDGDPQTAIDASLVRFSSCEELEQTVSDSWLETLLASAYSDYGYYGEEEVLDDGDVSEAPNESGDQDGDDAAGPSDYSETNNQEAGVDEPDIVKTDGNFLYIVQASGSVDIVKSFPANETAKVGSVELLGSGYPTSAFLQGNQLVVVSYMYDQVFDDSDYNYYGSTRVSFIDVSDRTAPTVVREIDLQGSMSTARKIGDQMYIVDNHYTDVPYELWELVYSAYGYYEDYYGEDTAANDLNLPERTWDETPEELAVKRAQARAILRPYVESFAADHAIDRTLPKFSSHLPDEEGAAENLLSCTDLFHNEGINQPSVLAVVNIPLGEDDPEVSATGLFANGWTVYASEASLYVAQANYWWWWGYGEQPDLSTHVHKFALDGADTVYEASGAIDGWLLNQFSMGEHNDDLRVATTDIDWNWGWESDNQSGEAPANNVFVLRQDGDDLNVVGSLTGIAPEEQIYSARFTGDTGYLVTFQQIDPLFTIDLSDPTSPTVRGELEIPGYSSYLHPVGEDYLLAVGMAGDMDGNISGLAVRLFDVADLDNPTMLDELTFGSDEWGYSDALWDSHAFTYHNDVLSIPLYTYDWDENTGEYTGFSGLSSISVDLDNGSLTEIGRVDHTDLVAASECLYDYYYGEDEVIVEEGEEGTEEDSTEGSEGSDGADNGSDTAEPPPDEGGDSDAPYYDEDYDPCAYDYWYANLRRSVSIDDNLYSISDYGVKVTETLDPSNVLAQVVFRPKLEEEPPVEEELPSEE